MKNLFFCICIIYLFSNSACKEKSHSNADQNYGQHIDEDSAFIINSLISYTVRDTTNEYYKEVLKPELYDSLAKRLHNAWKDTIGNYVIWRIESLNCLNNPFLMFYIKNNEGLKYFYVDDRDPMEDSLNFDMSYLTHFVSVICSNQKKLSLDDIELIKEVFLLTKIHEIYFYDYPTGGLRDYVHEYLNRGHSFMPDNYFLNGKYVREIKNENDIDTLLSICRSSYLQIALPEANDFSDTLAYNEYLTKSLQKVNAYITTKIDKEQRRILNDRCAYIYKQLKEIRSSLEKGNTFYFYSIPDLRLYKLEINQDSKNRVKLNGYWLDPLNKPKTIFLKDIPYPYSDDW